MPSCEYHEFNLAPLSPSVSSQEWQPSEQPPISGSHPWLVSLLFCQYNKELTFALLKLCFIKWSFMSVDDSVCQIVPKVLAFLKSFCPYFFSLFHCCSLQNEKWMNVRVGDIIKLENKQFVAVSVHPTQRCTPSLLPHAQMHTFVFIKCV